MSTRPAPQRSAPPSLTILVDGSAMFAAKIAADETRPMDYLKFRAEIQARMQDSVPRLKAAPRVIYFSSEDPSNQGQQKFHRFLRERAGFQVVLKSPADSYIGNPALGTHTASIRFDGLISYTLGGQVAAKSSTAIVVVTDSFALHAPLLHASTHGVEVGLAFFGRSIDPRYFNFFRQHPEIRFWELGEFGLFGEEFAPSPTSETTNDLF